MPVRKVGAVTGRGGSRRWRRTWTAVFLTAAVGVASCTTSNGVRTDSAVVIDESTEGPVAPSTAPSEDNDPAPAELPSLSPNDAETTTGTLDNGLRYLVRSNDNPGGKVELRLVIDAGSGLEDDTQVGGAHFLEHMLFNGTERFPKNELIDVLRSFGAAFGADINASTSRDQTIYTLNVPNDAEIVETALDILEDWLTAATIDPDEVEAERGIVLDEWRSRGQTAAGRVFDELADFYLADTEYDGHSPIGGREAIETITPDALRRFYDDWYRPDNAAVIVIGDVVAAEIEDEIIERFEDVASRGDQPERRVMEVVASADTRARIVDDPDLAEGSTSVTLPLALDGSRSIEEDAQIVTLSRIGFDIIATRLENDALRGDAPFDQAGVSSSSIVRELDAPEIQVELDGVDVGAAVQAIVDEYERVIRFGFTQAEIDRAVGSRRSSAQRNFDGRESRQDVSYADEYTRHVLEGEWYVEAEREFEFVNAVLDGATRDSVAGVFAERYGSAGAHVFVAVPDEQAGDVASEADLLALIDEAADRELVAREAEAAIGDSLMERPAEVNAVGQGELATDPFTDALDPLVLEFANGARVSLNTTAIVEQEIFFEARSPGGLLLVADGDIADAQALSNVISESGVGSFDRVSLDAFLDDKSVSFTPFVDRATSGMSGTVATPDAEVLFQMINLMMTAPRVDQTAIDRYVDDQGPFAEDPSIDAGYAEFVALLNARYDDPRYLAPTPESLATVDVEGSERVAADRFGSARNWSFAFSGDYDINQLTELAAAYIGSLDAGEDAGAADFSEPPAPAGIVVVDAEAGQGETANVSFLFTGSATPARSDDVTARVVREVIGNRLTDFIREELGDSYSPFAQIELGGGGVPQTEIYISVSTSADLVEDVSAAVLRQLEDLRVNGPSDRELSNAITTVGEQLNFINNAQINDEVLDVLVDGPGNASFDEFVNQPALIGKVTAADVDGALNAWTSADQFIEVRVLPGR
jgi:zinc protease